MRRQTQYGRGNTGDIVATQNRGVAIPKHNVDMAPTIIRILGVKPDKTIDGRALAPNQDRFTPKVWLTRGSNRGLYNIRQESTFTRATSPADTEWAFGTTADLPNRTFTTWVTFHGDAPPCQVEGTPSST